MPLHQILREKRKALGLTQEQVADYLGVTAPAVNKWEKGATFPDVALLPPLARLLKTDLNTLLGFHEGPTPQEIGHITHEIVETIRKNGFEQGFEMGMEKVREYPGCGPLLHSVALVLDGSLLLHGADVDKKPYEDRILELYERAVKSGDEKVRDRAAYMLASKYTTRERFEKAQEMLDLLPERDEPDKRKLQADLWVKQGKPADAAKLLERKLLTQIMELQLHFITLGDIALKEGRGDDARRLAELSRGLIGLLGLWDYSAYVAPFQLAVAQENAEESLQLLRSMLSAVLKPWDAKASPLFRHIPFPETGENAGLIMLPALLRELEESPKYAFLRENVEFRQLIAQYRALIPPPQKTAGK